MSSSTMLKDQSGLSKRGAAFAGSSIRGKAGPVLDWRPYHPTKNPEGLVNMGPADNLNMLDDVASFIKSKDLQWSGDDFNYGEAPWGSRRLRTAMEKYINKYFQPHTAVKADELVFSSGCTSIFHLLGMTLADSGDGILLTMPCYAEFAGNFQLVAGLQPVFVSFRGSNQFAQSAVDCYEAARLEAERSGIRIRALMLCNPHNPLGQCYPKETIIELMRFCNRHKIHLLADEIYAQSVYEVSDPAAVPFTSVISFDYSQYLDPNYLHLIYGMAKDFACGGLKIGVLWSRKQDLIRATSKIAQFSGNGTIDEKVAILMLEDEAWVEEFQQQSRTRLAQSSALARSLLDEAGINYSTQSNAGFFFWVDLSAWLAKQEGNDDWEREQMLMKRMVDNKVFMINGKTQAAEKPGCFRMVFSRDENTLREGFRRLLKALNE